MINKILIRKSDRKTLHKDRRSLGMSGENLQEVLLFCLDEKVEGTGIVEVELPNGEKGMIEVERTEEGYELPVKSSLLTQTGFVKFQLRILHDNEEIFKSEIIPLEVKDSINATETIPEQYPTWIDILTNLKQDLEKSESERVSNENERISAEKTRQENFTEMQKEVTSAVSSIEDLKEDYDENAKSKTEQFNSNYETKQKAINDNAEAKTTAFGENAEAQTKTFNTNSDDKLAEYNRNHTAKMKEFDDNYDTKTKTFDDNAADKVKEYNTNVEQKETELENLAEEKINEYNQVSAELTAKVKQVQAENESLKAENKLIKEQIPSATASGNNIHIEDSGSLDFDWKIRGGHKQERREGYNIINTKLLTQINTKGIDRIINDDGSLTIKGTATAESNIQVLASEEEKLKEGNYTFVCYGLAADYYVNIYYVGNVYGENIRSFSTDGTKNIKMILTIPEGKTVNFKIYPFLIKGTYTKETIPTYEQYGASPSPDYPSEVRTVGDNINILPTTADEWEQGGFDNAGNPNVINTKRLRMKNFADIIGDKWYASIFGDGYTYSNIFMYDKNENYIGEYYSSISSAIFGATSIALTFPTNCKKIKAVIKNQNSNKDILNSEIELAKPKLEKGTVQTSWSPYNQGSVEIDVVNSNLLDFNVAQDSRVTVNEDGTLTINGTGGFVLNIDKLQLKAGITYYQKVELISGSISGSNINTTFLSFAGDGVWISSEIFTKSSFNEDTKKTAIWINASATFDNAVIKIWANTDKSDFVKHQSQTAIMPIQQEMLEGDYVADVEHHEWKKLILTGDEEFEIANSTKGFNAFLNRKIIQDNSLEDITVYCNNFKSATDMNFNLMEDNTIFGGRGYQHQLLIRCDKYTTIEDFKVMLKAKYESGNPVTIYYKLAEPIDLELTPEQKSIRENKLYTYKNITNIAVSDELASIDVEYKKDLETEHNKLQNEIDEIKQLLSTTQTSALLLDNLQKEVEMEVE